VLFKVLKEKGVPMVEEVLTETPFGNHHEIVVDIDVTKIARENLTVSEGRDAAVTVAGTTRDDAVEEERVEV
jgi:hypothetical protein